MNCKLYNKKNQTLSEIIEESELFVTIIWKEKNWSTMAAVVAQEEQPISRTYQYRKVRNICINYYYKFLANDGKENSNRMGSKWEWGKVNQ